MGKILVHDYDRDRIVIFLSILGFQPLDVPCYGC